MAELTEKYGKGTHEYELIGGSGGVFDVVVDGQRVFCKKEVGRFPGYAEIPMTIDKILINR